MTARIDAPTDTTRCKHEMVPAYCAICRRLPFRPLPDEVDPAAVDRHVATVRKAQTPHPRDRRRRFEAERHGECARCSEPITSGQTVEWSPEDAGVIGACCMDEVAE
jgi:hypothetical protein